MSHRHSFGLFLFCLAVWIKWRAIHVAVPDSKRLFKTGILLGGSLGYLVAFLGSITTNNSTVTLTNTCQILSLVQFFFLFLLTSISIKLESIQYCYSLSPFFSFPLIIYSITSTLPCFINPASLIISWRKNHYQTQQSCYGNAFVINLFLN